MLCPQCGEVTAPGPLDARTVARPQPSLILRLVRRFGRLARFAREKGGA